MGRCDLGKPFIVLGSFGRKKFSLYMGYYQEANVCLFVGNLGNRDAHSAVMNLFGHVMMLLYRIRCTFSRTGLLTAEFVFVFGT